MTEMTDMNNYKTYALRIQSADERPRSAFPEGWYPTVAALMVYDDELEQISAGVWYRFFDGGHNGIHFVMRDDDHNFYHLDGAFGSYELSVPNVNGGYPNAYDAFWMANQEAGISQTAHDQPPG